MMGMQLPVLSPLLQGERKKTALSDAPSYFWQGVMAQECGVRRQQLIQNILQGLKEVLLSLQGKQGPSWDGHFLSSSAFLGLRWGQRIGSPV